MSTRHAKQNLSLQSLEVREVPAVTYAGLTGSHLAVYTDNAPTTVTTSLIKSAIRVTDGSTGRTFDFAASAVTGLSVYGGTGNDRLEHRVSWLPAYLSGGAGQDSLYGSAADDRLNGGSGNDYLSGGDGRDQLRGGEGNDILDGGAGNDRVFGEGGFDTLQGHIGDDTLVGGDGNDVLYGEDGHDQLIGGAGHDALHGGNDDDTLVTIDGVAVDYGDFADGGPGNDAVWRDVGKDAYGFTRYDDAIAESVKTVGWFANGADRTLDGDRFADPADATNLVDFSANPLFGRAGPVVDDVDQGNLGDCWLMATVGAIANDHPTRLRHRVVDFGDGTYGINLGANYYRVDADLPTVPGTTTPVYAGLGADGALWAAIVEKAYIPYRFGLNSYASLSGGWPAGPAAAFGLANPASRYFAPSATGASLANEIFRHWNAYQCVTICTDPTVPAGSRLVANHCYTVTWVDRDEAGAVTGVWVRNPWGSNGGLSNPYRYLTPAQLAVIGITVSWGDVV